MPHARRQCAPLCFATHIALALAGAIPPALALDAPKAAQRLMAAYPDAIAGMESGVIVWRDGTRMPIDDGKGPKAADELLEAPDLEDIFAWPYPKGQSLSPPPDGHDPGRARPAAFFQKLYGDCRKGEVSGHLVDVVWLPRKSGQRLRVTSLNGAAEKLAAVSAELDLLPTPFDVYLKPPAGAYLCRPIAGTERVSPHGYGIAVDIATARSDYWRWSKPDAPGRKAWRNRIPKEIVEIFERHGFVWGGRWHHFDTMHFEYRPELLID